MPCVRPIGSWPARCRKGPRRGGWSHCGDDGHISTHTGVGPVKRRLLAMFQESDRYHVRKLKRLYRPDLMTPEERAAGKQRPWLLNLHRLIGAPLRDLRRKFLEWVGAR